MVQASTPLLDVKSVEFYATVVVGVLVLLGFLRMKGVIAFTSDKSDKRSGTATGDGAPVSQAEFDKAMNALNQRLDVVAAEAQDALLHARSASTSLQQIAQMIESSMRTLGDRFDRAIDRLDSAVDKVVDRLDDHETRLSRNEASLEQRNQVVDLLMKRATSGNSGS